MTRDAAAWGLFVAFIFLSGFSIAWWITDPTPHPYEEAR